MAKDKEQDTLTLEEEITAAFEASGSDDAKDKTGQDETDNPDKKAADDTGETKSESAETPDQDKELKADEDKEESQDDEDDKDDKDEGKEEFDEDEAAAPEHWDDQQKTDFEELPDEARPLYLSKVKSLESGYNEKFEALASERKELETVKGFKEMFAPFEQHLAMAGTNPEAYTKQLLATAQMLAQDPENTLRQLATQYGVTFEAGKPNGAGEPDLDTEYQDPAIRGLTAKIDDLSSQLNSSQQLQQVGQVRQVEHEWAAFVNAKGDDGVELYPSAINLKRQVGNELAANPEQPGETTQSAFKRAYESVKWTLPEIRDAAIQSKISEASKSETDKEAKEKRRKDDLAKAKKAGRNVKSKSASVTDADEPAPTRKEELERAFDQAETSA